MLFSKRRTLIIFVSLVWLSLVNAAEFAVINETVTLTAKDASDWSTSGFNWWYNTSVGPSNWASPDDYWNGEFYMRMEVVSKPTNTATQFQFGIWSNEVDGKWAETVSSLSMQLGGNGSYTTFSGSPSDWWCKTPEVSSKGLGCVNFWNPGTFNRFGVVYRGCNGSIIDKPPFASSAASAEVWADRNDYYPLTLKVTVVAVSNGATFSGWGNYGTSGGNNAGSPAACGSGTGGGGGTDPCAGIDKGHIDPAPTPSGNAIQGESMTLSNYFSESISAASGGSLASLWNGTSGNSTGSISTNFPHTDGIYNIKVVYLNEHDGASNFRLRIGDSQVSSWTGTQQDCQNRFATQTIYNQSLANGIEIRLEGENNVGAWAKIDYIDFELVSGGGGGGGTDPCEGIDITVIDAAPTPSANAVQGESMTLSSYFSESISSAAGGNVASLWNGTIGNPTGSISTNFALADGDYNIKVVYLNENDGASNFRLIVGGAQVNSWTGTKQDCRNKFETKTISNQPLANGVEIKIEGDNVDAAWAKIDYIDFELVPGGGSGGGSSKKGSELSIEAEDFTTKNNYFVQGGELASMGHVALLFDFSDLSPKDKGNTSVDFPHGDGNYDIIVNFINEDEGTSSYVLKINDVEIDSWSSVENDNEWLFEDRVISDINLFNGDKITLEGTRGGKSYAKFDYIDFVRNGDIPENTPSYTINYMNEETNENIAVGHQYSTDQTNWTTGDNSPLELIPGVDVYFRVIANTSSSQILNVPDRPAAPSFGINYQARTTIENISAGFQYSSSSDMSGASTGEGSPIAVTPGGKMYFIQSATASTFDSDIRELQIPAIPSKPAYTINFSAETTHENVETSVQYANNAEFTGATQGKKQPINLTPGSTYYFKKPATSSSFESEVLYLSVPERAAKPIFSVDFVNETTKENVSGIYQYSTSAQMIEASSGINEKIALTPGTDLYIREASTISSFASNTLCLIVPVRNSAPAFTIDYINETSAEAIPSGFKYSNSANMSSSTTGTNTKVDLSPGSNMYFQEVATASSFASQIQSLEVPAKAKLAFSIDYHNETTKESVGSDINYSEDESFSDAQQGENKALKLSANTDVYFVKPATASSFVSQIQKLEVPDRPSKPSYTINFKDEKTNESVSSDVSYSSAANMSDAVDGGSEAIILIPGEDKYFQIKATDNQFKSEVSHLIVPERPASPTFEINYEAETTNSAVASNVSYSQLSSFSNAEYGADKELDLTPGTDLYFKSISTTNKFASETFKLKIPERPLISSALKDTTSLSEIPVSVSPNEAGFELTNLQLINCDANKLVGGSFNLIPNEYGLIEAFLTANSFEIGNFKSEPFSIEYIKKKEAPSWLKPTQKESLSIYPQPANEYIMVKMDKNLSDPSYSIYDSRGKLIQSDILNQNANKISVEQLTSGIYILMVQERKSAVATQKFIIQ